MSAFPINHIALGARDPEKLAEFYQLVLGLQRLHVVKEDGQDQIHAVWLGLNPGTILMVERAGMEAPPPPADFQINRFPPGYRLVSIQIELDRRDYWEERLNAAGIPVAHQTDYTLYIRDPEGNPLGLTWFDARAYLAPEA